MPRKYNIPSKIMCCYCRNSSCPIPYGLCHCGCGQRTIIANRTDTNAKMVKGIPNRFIVGHSMQGRKFSLESRKKKSESMTRHGHSGGVFFVMSRAYSTWIDMIARCSSSKGKQAKDYYGRGITVCERWKKFDNFIIDMGEVPDGLTLERINNDGNYEPGNCKWATRKEQSNNTRRNVFVVYKGTRMTRQQLVDLSGLSKSTVYYRLKRGLSPEEAVSLLPYQSR